MTAFTIAAYANALPTTSGWLRVAYSSSLSLFAAIRAGGGGNNQIATSPDGITWTPRTHPSSNLNWTDMIWTGSLFVAAGPVVSTSPDGITWTDHAIGLGRPWSAIAFGAGQYVVVQSGTSDNNARSSPDATTWTTRNLTTSGALGWRAIIFANSKFVALSTSQVVNSNNGTAWTQNGSVASSRSWSKIAWNGSIYCAVAQGSNVCMTSPDGENWTSRNMPQLADWTGICWNGSIFLAVASDGVAAESADGITWTAVTMPSAANWRAVEWDGIQFVVIAEDRTIATLIPIAVVPLDFWENNVGVSQV